MTQARAMPLAASIVLAACVAAGAQTAPNYPSQTVRIVVPFSAGSTTDGLARILAEKLGETWKQTVLVENRPGIAGTNGVAKSAADGLTLLLTSNGHTIAAVVNKQLPFDPAKDFVGVAPVASVPQVLLVPKELQAKTVGDWIALARARPGQMNFSSGGLASTSYLGAERLKQLAKIDIVHIPQRGSPEGVTSLMRGEAQLFFLSVHLAAELHQSGKVRAMAIARTQRTPALPNVPTVAESGLPQYDYDAWFGVLAPAGTPRAVLNKINQGIAGVLKMPDVAGRLSKQGVDIVFKSVDEFDAQLKAEVVSNSAMLRAAGVGDK